MKKRKVLFICPSLCQGGLEHYQVSMLKTLDKEKFDITLFLYLKDITLLPMVPDYVKVVIDQDDNHYFRRPRAVWLTILKKICSLLKVYKWEEKCSNKLKTYIHDEKMRHPAKDIFKNERFDVIVSNVIGQGTEMALYIPAEKYFVFYHGSFDMHHELMEQLFPKYEGVVAVSTGVQDMLKAAYPMLQDKILLLENYIDADEILDKSKYADDRYNLIKKENRIRISSCGRITSEKGFDLAVKTAAVLKEKGYSFIWYFIGDGKERTAIEAMVKEYSLEDEIYITGYTSNPFFIMKNSDIYVQPSYEESYGRTIKEAMILGCPVVSTDTVGAKTLIQNEENGLLVHMSEYALAEGIICLIENEKLRNIYSVNQLIKQNEREKNTFKEKLEQMLS